MRLDQHLQGAMLPRTGLLLTRKHALRAMRAMRKDTRKATGKQAIPLIFGMHRDILRPRTYTPTEGGWVTIVDRTIRTITWITHGRTGDSPEASVQATSGTWGVEARIVSGSTASTSEWPRMICNM
jgi:hypothetical protein